MNDIERREGPKELYYRSGICLEYLHVSVKYTETHDTLAFVTHDSMIIGR